MENDAIKLNALVLADAYQLVARIPSASVDLAYLDPPLSPDSDSDGEGDADRALREHLQWLGRVLQQVRRVLKPTGNMFMHSTPGVNGYIRLMLDQVLGRSNFRHEYILPFKSSRQRAEGHHTLFFYGASKDSVVNHVFRVLSAEEIRNQFPSTDGRGSYVLVSLLSPAARPDHMYEWRGYTPPPNHSWGYARAKLDSLFDEGRIVMTTSSGQAPRQKRYLDERAEVEIGTVWDDLPLSMSNSEKLGYRGQKPINLIDRIIRIGSNAGGVVLDPYCGSGTTLVAAQNLGMRWFGGDAAPDAIGASTARLTTVCGLVEGRDYQRHDSGAWGSRQAFPVPNRPLATGIDDFAPSTHLPYSLGQALHLEETRHVEFKEVKGANPVGAIANAADEYAVAFLNGEGGHIFWGVSDNGFVVGVKLNSVERNELRRSVTSKLHGIQPASDPTHFRFELRVVKGGAAVEDELFVAELSVPGGEVDLPYYTGGGDAFVRVDGIKRKLKGPELTAWIKRRIGARGTRGLGPSPDVTSLLGRIRLAFTAHGLEVAHLQRFFAGLNAPFQFRLYDARSDDAFLEWIDDETKLSWIADTLGVRREWLDGEDPSIYRRRLFDKNPRAFWESAAGASVERDRVAFPEAYFIRWGKGDEWRRNNRLDVFVVLAVPLAQINSERIIYRYISDFTPYPWGGRRTFIQLRAWARLLFCQGGFFIHGREMSYTTGEKFMENQMFLRDFLDDQNLVLPIDWHPEDYGLTATESVAAREVDTLPEVLEFLRKHALPTECRMLDRR